MSYQVMALKWRPKTFDRMIGQKHIGQTLTNALKSGRLPQALLFTGPRGTGKTSTARILAKALRCLNPKDFVPCGQCSECLDISLSRSLDVIEIDGASNNGVDAIRELRDSVSFRPSSGSKKIYIIDEVHMLSISAFNALLKTLEEPPEHIVFMMATTEVHKIPKTILSRCHRFDFRKVSIQEVTEHLEYVCNQEGVAFEKEALWALARQAGGSVRDSFSYLDQVITYSGPKITYQDVIESLGLTDRRLMTALLSDVVATDTASLMTHMEDIFISGSDVGVFAEEFLEQIKNLLITKTSSEPEKFLDLPVAEVEILKGISQKISLGHIHILFDLMFEVTQNLMRSQDQKTILEVGLLKLCLYPKIVDLKKEDQRSTNPALVAKSELKPLSKAPSASQNFAPQSSVPQVTSSQNSGSQNISSQNLTAATLSPTSSGAVSSSADFYQTPEQKQWHEFVAKVSRLNIKMGATLQNCIYRIQDQEVQVSAPEKLVFIKKDLEKPEFQKILSNYIKTFLGPDFKLKTYTQAPGVTSVESSVEEVPLQPQVVPAVTPNTALNATPNKVSNKAPNVVSSFSSSIDPSKKTVQKEQEDMTAEQKRRLMESVSNSETFQILKQTFKDAEIVDIKEIKS
jgi:DNA polymerase III subunit gamma/tau